MARGGPLARHAVLSYAWSARLPKWDVEAALCRFQGAIAIGGGSTQGERRRPGRTEVREFCWFSRETAAAASSPDRFSGRQQRNDRKWHVTRPWGVGVEVWHVFVLGLVLLNQRHK